MRFHYVFQARDYDAAVRFYGTGLGLPVIDSWDRGSDKGTMFRAAGGVVEVVSDSLGLRGPDGRGIAIQVPDVDAVYQSVLDAGLTVEQPPGPRPWGTKEFILLDPDRHAVTFFETPAESKHPQT
ncbi:MAG: VOC family protein [Micromonosporaceae bacterium]|nr:VOC family protein [Micromonosporaceae bacterium]